MNFPQIQYALSNILAALIIVAIAALVLSACAPNTIELPPLPQPNWP